MEIIIGDRLDGSVIRIDFAEIMINELPKNLRVKMVALWQILKDAGIRKVIVDSGNPLGKYLLETGPPLQKQVFTTGALSWRTEAFLLAVVQDLQDYFKQGAQPVKP